MHCFCLPQTAQTPLQAERVNVRVSFFSELDTNDGISIIIYDHRGKPIDWLFRPGPLMKDFRYTLDRVLYEKQLEEFVEEISILKERFPIQVEASLGTIRHPYFQGWQVDPVTFQTREEHIQLLSGEYQLEAIQALYTTKGLSIRVKYSTLNK